MVGPHLRRSHTHDEDDAHGELSVREWSCLATQNTHRDLEAVLRAAHSVVARVLQPGVAHQYV